MSTFGKKALIWWDYHDLGRDNFRRFNSTPKQIQLLILEKWYPIGTIVIFRNREYLVDKYNDELSGYKLSISTIDDMKLYLSISPLSLKPSIEFERKIKREHKINRILS